MTSGKNVPGWLSESRKKLLRKDEDYLRRIELLQVQQRMGVPGHEPGVFLSKNVLLLNIQCIHSFIHLYLPYIYFTILSWVLSGFYLGFILGFIWVFICKHEIFYYCL